MSCNGTYTDECNVSPPLSFLIWLTTIAFLAVAFVLALIVRRGTVLICRRRRVSGSASASETTSSVYLVSSASLQDASALNVHTPPEAAQPPPSYEELQMEELPPHYDVAYSMDIR